MLRYHLDTCYTVSQSTDCNCLPFSWSHSLRGGVSLYICCLFSFSPTWPRFLSMCDLDFFFFSAKSHLAWHLLLRLLFYSFHTLENFLLSDSTRKSWPQQDLDSFSNNTLVTPVLHRRGSQCDHQWPFKPHFATTWFRRFTTSVKSSLFSPGIQLKSLSKPQSSFD